MITLDVVVRTTVLLALAWIVSRMLRTRATAATRHLLWQLAVIAVLAAPILGPLAPAIRVPGVPEVPGVPRVLVQEVLGVRVPDVRLRDTKHRSSATSTPSTFSTRTSGTLGTLGTLGTSAAALFFAWSHFAAMLLARRSHPAPCAWQREADALRARMGIGRNVRLRILPDEGMPVAIGLFRSVVLLPETAACWTAERRESVLLHELAHVRRGDCRGQAVAHAACALYWFNPLIWIAVRELRREREHACDDEVLRAGMLPSDYAGHLLDLAASMRRSAPAAALAMARPKEIEHRVMAVLGARHARTPAKSTRWAIAVAVTCVTATALGATTSPQPLTSRRPAVAASVQINPERRADLVSMANEQTPAESIATLVTALDDQSGDVREKAAMGLALVSGPEAIAPLLNALKDPNSQVREKAAIGLSFRRDPRIVDPLIAALSDSDSQVREKAAIALGASGDSRAADALQRALRDPDWQVRDKAEAGLKLLESGAAIDGSVVRDNLRRAIGGILALAK